MVLTKNVNPPPPKYFPATCVNTPSIHIRLITLTSWLASWSISWSTSWLPLSWCLINSRLIVGRLMCQLTLVLCLPKSVDSWLTVGQDVEQVWLSFDQGVSYVVDGMLIKGINWPQMPLVQNSNFLDSFKFFSSSPSSSIVNTTLIYDYNNVKSTYKVLDRPQTQSQTLTQRSFSG